MKTFLICPVRGHNQEETRAIVERLESEGWRVHWPPRDTNQDDPTGLSICGDNRQAIQDADAVHVVWDGQSQGCLFDLGMAFAMGKRVIPLDLPNLTTGKSFQNMVIAWAKPCTHDFMDLILPPDRREEGKRWECSACRTQFSDEDIHARIASAS